MNEYARSALSGAPRTWRATLVTDVVGASPQGIQYLAGPTAVPAAVAATLLATAVGLLTGIYLVTALGALLSAALLIWWLWPREEVLEKLRRTKIGEEAALPVLMSGTRSVGWWGMVSLITVLVMALGVLLFSYFYLRLYSESWPQGGLTAPALFPALGVAGLLLVSALPMWAAAGGLLERRMRRALFGLSAVILLGIGSFVGLLVLLDDLNFLPQANAYASVFYTLLWYLCLLVIPGLFLVASALAGVRRGFEERGSYLVLQMQIASLYWYFLVLAGTVTLGILYIAPYVG